MQERTEIPPDGTGLFQIDREEVGQQAQVLKKQWALLQTKDCMVAALIWSWADYRHQPMRPDSRWMNRIYFSHGLVDLRRRPKLALEIIKDLFHAR